MQLKVSGITMTVEEVYGPNGREPGIRISGETYLADQPMVAVPHFSKWYRMGDLPESVERAIATLQEFIIQQVTQEIPKMMEQTRASRPQFSIADLLPKARRQHDFPNKPDKN